MRHGLFHESNRFDAQLSAWSRVVMVRVSTYVTAMYGATHNWRRIYFTCTLKVSRLTTEARLPDQE